MGQSRVRSGPSPGCLRLFPFSSSPSSSPPLSPGSQELGHPGLGPGSVHSPRSFAKPTWGWAWTQAPNRGALAPGILGKGGEGREEAKAAWTKSGPDPRSSHPAVLCRPVWPPWRGRARWCRGRSRRPPGWFPCPAQPAGPPSGTAPPSPSCSLEKMPKGKEKRVLHVRYDKIWIITLSC